MNASSDLEQHRANFWPALSAIIVGAFMAILSNTLINVAIPSLMADFNTTLSTVQWVLTGFMLAMGTVIPITGYLGDRFSYKTMYLIALVGFTLSSALCAASWSVSSMITFRVLQGLFGGMVMPLSMTMVYQIVPLEKRGMALGVWGIAAMAGPAIGPTLSGWIIQNASWRWLFIVNIPVGVIAVIIGMRLLPYYRLAAVKSLDVFGLVTAVICSLAFLFAFSEGNDWGWTSGPIVGLLCAGVVSLVLFIVRELTADEPLLELRVFRRFRFTVSVIVSSLITVGLFSGMYLTPVFLQNVQGTRPIDVGLILLPAALLMAVCMPITGRLFDRLGGRFLVPIGVFFIAFGTWQLRNLEVATPHSFLVFWMMVRNFGIAMAMMPATTSGMNVIPVALAGRASSINNWVRQVLGSFSIGLFTSILSARQAFHAAVYSEQVQMFSPSVQRLMTQASQTPAATGGSPLSGPTLALLNLYKQVQLQAFTRGIGDVFAIATVLVAIAIPIGFLLGGRARRPTAAPAGGSPTEPITRSDANLEPEQERDGDLPDTGVERTPPQSKRPFVPRTSRPNPAGP